MNSNRNRRCLRNTSVRRGGFTLVELMIVIAIIAMLSTIFLGALDKAEQTSKVARTKSLVQKLHNIMMARWDAYRTVRLPINVDSSIGGGAFANASNEAQSRFRVEVAQKRMLAIRELIRMEMPDRFDDLLFTPSVLISPMGNAPIRPYLWNAYQRRIISAKAANAGTRTMEREEFLNYAAISNQSAECLYLIMTTGVDDPSTSTEHFRAVDFGDSDKDGLPEFRDAWGNPIDFIRWAPGFVSPMQPLFKYRDNDPKASVFHKSQPRDIDDPQMFVSRWKIQIEQTTDTNFNPAKIVSKLLVIDQDDPFNPMRVGPTPDNVPGTGWTRSSRWRPGDEAPEHGFILIPLIYSRGGDFISGIDHCYAKDGYSLKQSPTSFWGGVQSSDPYNLYENKSASLERYRGVSLNDGRAFDNIHNQQLGTN